MSLSLEEVRRAAALSRLRLTAAEEETFAEQLGRVVAHIDHLQEFESRAEVSDPASGVEAADDPQPDQRGELFLENAPDVRGRFFAVPRMRAGGNGSTAPDLPDE